MENLSTIEEIITTVVLCVDDDEKPSKDHAALQEEVYLYYDYCHVAQRYYYYS